MAFRVRATPTAKRDIDGLSGKAKDAFWQKYAELEREGCAAADYRLVGEIADRICSVHLYGSWRALVGFPASDQVAVLIVERHEARRGELDVYRRLYRQLGIGQPSETRTKPPCCEEDGAAPVEPELIDRFVEGAKRLRRERRRGRS